MLAGLCAKISFLWILMVHFMRRIGSTAIVGIGPRTLPRQLELLLLEGLSAQISLAEGAMLDLTRALSKSAYVCIRRMRCSVERVFCLRVNHKVSRTIRTFRLAKQPRRFPTYAKVKALKTWSKSAI